MANVVYPDAGLIFMLQQIVASNLHLHIFTNNVTPSDSTTLGGLTEAAWTGYALETLSSGSFVSLGVGAHVGTLAYPTVTFTNGSGSPVSAYGFYITDTANAILVSCGLFDAAPVSIAAGGTYSFIPTISDQSQY
jgi:hypothetical protein